MISVAFLKCRHGSILDRIKSRVGFRYCKVELVFDSYRCNVDNAVQFKEDLPNGKWDTFDIRMSDAVAASVASYLHLHEGAPLPRGVTLASLLGCTKTDAESLYSELREKGLIAIKESIL